jgi:hypothetical protein
VHDLLSSSSSSSNGVRARRVSYYEPEAGGQSDTTMSKATGSWGATSSSSSTIGSLQPSARHPLAWARCQGVLPSLWGGLGCLRPAADMDLEPALGGLYSQQEQLQQEASVQGVGVAAGGCPQDLLAGSQPAAQQRAADGSGRLPAGEAGSVFATTAPAAPLDASRPPLQDPAWRAPQLFDAHGHLIAEPVGEPAWEAWYFAVGPADTEWLVQAAPQLRLLRIT